jgi:acyl-CoA hydrolase
MSEKIKPVSYSKVQQIQLVMPQHSNNAGRLFGGQLMAWIDLAACVVAFRHSEEHCTTASVDYLSFDRPIYVNDIIVLYGCMTYVGNSSMEIRVDTFTERAGLVRELANRAYLTFVSIDENGRPKRVPRLEIQTEAERLEWEDGVKRAELRRQHRAAGGSV